MYVSARFILTRKLYTSHLRGGIFREPHKILFVPQPFLVHSDYFCG
jgi:hypothetical protein